MRCALLKSNSVKKRAHTHIVKKPNIRPRTHRGNQTVWLRSGFGSQPDPPLVPPSGFSLVAAFGFGPKPEGLVAHLGLRPYVSFHPSIMYERENSTNEPPEQSSSKLLLEWRIVRLFPFSQINLHNHKS